jgi:hypothetical protein
MNLMAILCWNLAALVPIALGWWDPFAVLACYWFENLCTGVVQFLKLRDRERFVPDRTQLFPMSRFFAMHYGMFTGVHGILVLVFFGIVMGGLQQGRVALGWSLLAIAIIHAFQFQHDWRRRQGWLATSTGRLMAEPYARVMVMHATVLAGGWLALSSQEPGRVLLLFAIVKLAIELLSAWGWSRWVEQRPSRP